MLLRTWAVLCAFVLLPARAAESADYGYPIENRYRATVLGTPAELQAEVPDSIPVRNHRLVRFEDREIPSIFWNQSRFEYSLAAQRGSAPLVFLVAGTGARHDAAKMVFLQKALFQAGFHVVALTSPTQQDFIVAASTASMPGNMTSDVEDLYAVMQQIAARHPGLRVSAYHLAGYSLDATQSAFLAHLDQSRRVFDFERVVLLCPSVSLFSSVRLLDDMLARAVPGGPRELDGVIRGLFAEVTAYFNERGRSGIDSELLYHVVGSGTLDDRRLQTAIGVVFRLSSAALLFTSDVMNQTGHVVEPDRRLGVSTSLTPYFKVSVRWTFENYLDDALAPYWSEHAPGTTRESLIAAGDLATIEDFLRGAGHVSASTASDEIILTGGDLAFLRDVFGERATIYPRGGHCGNLSYRENVADMLERFGIAGVGE